MRIALIYILLFFGCFSSAYAQEAVAAADVPTHSVSSVPGARIKMQGAFLEQLQPRDSVLIADQLLYGFELKDVLEGTDFGLPEVKEEEDSRLKILRLWEIDTVRISKARKNQPRQMDIKASMLITSFDEGIYELPAIEVLRRNTEGVVDTLVFDPMRLEVKTIPLDTASFEINDIKGQIRYPVTFREILPWILLTLAGIALIFTAVYLIRRYRLRHNPEYMHKDPAHIIALRKLDKYRGNKMWAPEHQKAFYSGVTDVLREYLEGRYGISAMEMTTAEIFEEFRRTDAPKELVDEVQELFERSDFVKFAKYLASDEDNIKVLPLAVRFVTETYQADIEAEEETAGTETPQQPQEEEKPVQKSSEELFLEQLQRQLDQKDIKEEGGKE